MGDKSESLSERLTGGLWDRIGSFFVKMWSEFWDVVSGPLEGLVKLPYNLTVGLFSETVDKAKENPIDEFINNQADPEAVLSLLKTISKGNPLLGVIYHVLEYAITAGGIAMANASATSQLATQLVQKKFTPTIPGIEYLIEAYFKNPDVEDEVKENFSRLGISEKNLGVMIEGTRALLSPGELREGYLRGKIDETKVKETLESYHFNEEDTKTIQQLYEIIPPIEDIITMAVREVFSPEIVEKFGQMEGFPIEFGNWAEKKGLSVEWAMNYWAAHWKLPGVRDGFEMLHRGVIDKKELAMLLKALDIMPFWRDRLTQISYNPYTRVDVRRMHKLGVLDDEQVFTGYLDLGYDEEKALHMTEFTLLYNQGSEREITKTDILGLYKKHALSSSDTIEKLIKIGFNDESAELLITKANYDLYASYKKQIIGYVKKAYIAGKMPEMKALSELGNIDMPSGEINYLMEIWDSERKSKVKLLSLDNLKAFYKANVISESELNGELKELGYNDQDTNRFITLFSKGG